MKLLLTSALAIIGVPLQAQEPGVPIASQGADPVALPAAQEREVTLNWPTAVHTTMEAAPYEVVVRFDVPLAEAEIARFSAAAGGQLGEFRWNDDSLVIRPAAGNRIEAAAQANAIRFRFIPETAGAGPTVTAESGPASEVELELARAQADASAGFPSEARRRLTRLAAAHPADKQIQRALADAEAADGAIAFAARRYRTLDADDRMARRIIAEADGRAAAQFILRHGKTFTQWEGGVEASVQPQFGWSIGGGLRQVTTTAQDVAGNLGYLARIHRSATVGSLTATILIGNQARLTAQVASLFDRPVTGVAARLYVGSPDRQARVVAAYRLPDFSTAEQSWFGGHVSRIGAGGTIRITPELIAQADLAWAGYGLVHRGVQTSTIVASAGADYLILRGTKSLQLSYRLDAEYVRRQDVRLNGIPYIPLSDRENHTIQAIFSVPVRMVQVTAAAGWTKDRFGGDGPTASVGAQANLGENWRLEASGGVSSISRQAVSGTQTYLQVTLTRFLRR